MNNDLMAGLDEERLKGIRARTAAATPGPWAVCCKMLRKNPTHIITPKDVDITHDILSNSDAEFIAHARTDIEWLLREVERLDIRANVIASQERVALATLRAQQAFISAKHRPFLLRMLDRLRLTAADL